MKNRIWGFWLAALILVFSGSALAHDGRGYGYPYNGWSGGVGVWGGAYGASGWSGTLSYQTPHVYAPRHYGWATWPSGHRHGPACHNKHGYGHHGSRHRGYGDRHHGGHRHRHGHRH